MSHLPKFLCAPLGPCLAVLLLIGLPGAVQAGAWTPKKGAAYHKFAVNHFSSDASFGLQNPEQRNFSDTNIPYYFEHGITDSLAVFGSAPYKRLSSERTENNGIGDIDLGVRYRLTQQGSLVLSTAWLLKLPYAYPRYGDLSLGNGQVDAEGRLLLGYGLGPYGYLGAELGYRYRAGAPADEFRYLLEYGFNATEKLYLRAKYDGIVGQKNSSSPNTAATNPTLNLEFDLTKLEVTSGWKLGKNSAAEFSVTRNTSGSNALRGDNYSLAWVYSY
jgi:hypothetical protein